MKNIYRIIFLLIFNSAFGIHNSFSQTAPAIEWQKCLGGTNTDWSYDIQQTNDGGYVIAGQTNSNDGDVSGLHGAADFWVVKLDSLSNIEWQKCLGGSNVDIAKSLAITQDGGYIIAGESNSNDGDVNGNHGGYDDCWIVKLDSVGTIQWQKCLGGNDGEAFWSIIQLSNGDYIATGETESNNGDVSGNHGELDVWVVQLDSIANIKWQKCYGGSYNDFSNSIMETADNGFILGGATISNDGDVVGLHYDSIIGTKSDAWIIKIDSMGFFQWQKCLGGYNQEWAYSVEQTFDGGYIVGGTTLSNDSFIVGNHGLEDILVIKLNALGIIEWQKCLGGSNGGDIAKSLAITQDGGYIITGRTSSNDGDVTGNHGLGDFWVVKLDSIGNIIWEKCYGGTSTDYPDAIDQTMDNGYVITGYTASDDNDVSGNHGGGDCWVVKLSSDTITGITNLQSSTFNFQFSPNPLTSHSTLTFSNPQKEKFVFTLYDITGRPCGVSPLERGKGCVITTGNKIILEKGNKQAGVYLFNLVNEKTGERMNGKIVIGD